MCHALLSILYALSHNPHKNNTWMLLLCPFYQRENKCKERLNNFTKTIHQVSGVADFKTSHLEFTSHNICNLRFTAYKIFFSIQVKNTEFHPI